jgi:hypothetical protein
VNLRFEHGGGLCYTYCVFYFINERRINHGQDDIA